MVERSTGGTAAGVEVESVPPPFSRFGTIKTANAGMYDERGQSVGASASEMKQRCISNQILAGVGNFVQVKSRDMDSVRTKRKWKVPTVHGFVGYSMSGTGKF
jgi:hypothetical protein